MRAFEFKQKKIEFDRLPVKPAGKPVYPAGIPVRTVSTGEFEFKFAFVRFRPVTGLTGPVSRNQTPAVRSDRSENLTLAGSREVQVPLVLGPWIDPYN